MGDVEKQLDDVLQHYGIKGMKWRSVRSDPQASSDTGPSSGSGADQSGNLNKFEADLENIKSKVGNGPLDMLKYIIFGTPKKSKTTNGSTNDKGPRTDDVFTKSVKQIKSKIGDGPLDMMKYVLFGKRKLQHSGVKGMHWGVHRNLDGPGGADGKTDVREKLPHTTIGKKLNSFKRERQWKSVLKEMDKLSNHDIKTATRRIELENNLKTLAKKIGNKKDKQEYLRRQHMSDEELARKVLRLRLKDSLHKAVTEASKEQKAFGQKITQIGGSLGVRYVLNKRLSTQDLFDVVKNPKASSDKAKEDIKNKGKDILKEMLDKTKHKTTP